ncbi:hypothetical protein B566_EDAN018432 [Ephemera danica]|nr:hypothetical protein B566_EDAN018432 [Ephemera danica]
MTKRLRALIEDELANSDEDGDVDAMQLDNDNDKSDSDWTDHESAMSEEDDIQEAPLRSGSPAHRRSPPPRDLSPVAPIQSSSDTSDSDDDVAPVNNSYKPIGTPYTAKDDIQWGKNPPRTSKTRDCNRLRGAIGPAAIIPPLAAITNPIDVFMLFLVSIIDEIVKFTNIEATRVYEINSYKTEWKPCDRIEMEAFIGLILMAGLMKDSKSSLNKLWSKDFGAAYFRATLSLHRFKQLLRYIRFDDRAERPADDKFAPIRNIFNIIVRKLGELYTPSVNITVDEQLVPFRGRPETSSFSTKTWTDNGGDSEAKQTILT